jgi:TRAP-type C4-dicarboxylate transport system permease small subunit
MQKALMITEKALDFLMAFLLTLMGIFIFGNIVLRYVFNSGITWAEELSRYMFVWLVFLGTVGAMKDNNHLGFTALVQKMPPTLKKITYICSNILVVICLWIVFDGSMKMTKMTLTTFSPTVGMPVATMYAVGIPVSVAMLLIVLFNLYKAFFVAGAIDQLVVLRESEEEIKLEDMAEGEEKQ